MEVINNPLNISPNKAFEWFAQNFQDKLENVFKSFWELEAKCYLLSLSDEPNFLALNKQFLVTRLKLSKRHTCAVKLSNNISKLLLDSSLGFKNQFDFDNLTDLEVKILTTFNCEIKNSINDFFLKKEELNKIPYNQDTDDKFFYLVFIVKIGNKTGNLIIIVPNEAVKVKLCEQKTADFDMSLFDNNKVNVDIIVGNTELKIADINRLDVEDILVLENSSLENMTLVLNKEEKVKFKLNPDPMLIVNNTEDENDEYEKTSEGDENIMANNNIWDDILVDVEARFEKVKLELGKVRRISKGEVVEIADVFKNKINLYVENKIIANGELVIINDKYGIKINELYSTSSGKDDKDTNVENNNFNNQSNEKNNMNSEHLSSNDNKGKNEQEKDINNDDENFDYSDFDVDDEDI